MKKDWYIEEVSMSNDVDKTIKKIDKALQENEQPVPRAAPTQRNVNTLALRLESDPQLDEATDTDEEYAYVSMWCHSCGDDYKESLTSHTPHWLFALKLERWQDHADTHNHTLSVLKVTGENMSVEWIKPECNSLWQKILYWFWNRSDKFWGTLNAICGGWAIFSLIIMKPQGFTAVMNWMSIGMSVTGFGIMLWRKLKRRQ